MTPSLRSLRGGRHRALLGATIAFALGWPVTDAAAQDQDSDDIIVTARKREEVALRVPAVPTVLLADELDREQVTDLFKVASLTPGLVLGSAPLEVGTEVSLRGIGSAPLDPGVDQSVALNLDGLPLGQGAAYSVGLFDVARIEVLKGPQPLFFGKNSPGGVIAIRTADPGPTTEIIGSGAYETEAREWQTRLILSGPVTDTLGLRLSTQYATSDGYFYNTAIPVVESGARKPAARIGGSHSLYVRLTGLFQPSADLTARLKFNATHDRILGTVPEQLVYCPEGTFNYLPTIGLDLPSQYSANENCKADRKVNIVDVDPRYYQGAPYGGVSFTKTDQRFGTLDLNWAITPHFALSSVTGYYHLKVDAMQNGPWSGGAAPPLIVIKALQREEVTQELRLSSDLGGPFDFTGGAFFQDASIKDSSSFPGTPLYGLPPLVLQGSHDVSVRSYALFGQLRVRPTARLEITGGVRWTDEKRSDAAVTYDVFGIYTGAAGTPVMPEVPRLHSRNWSPEVTISWFPNDRLTLYGAFKQGYKSGSYNINQPLNVGADNSFGDERGRGGEAGVKGYAADRQISFDLAAYRYQYSGLQVGVIQISDVGLPGLKTVNAGDAKVYGLDLILRYRPQAVPGLNLSGALNWNHGTFTRFSNATCYAGQTISEGCNQSPTPVTDPAEIATGYYAIDPVLKIPVRYNGQDLSGTPLPRAPRWQGTFSVDYERPGRGTLVWGLGAQVQYSSDYLVEVSDQRHAIQGVFAKIGANFRLRNDSDRWEIALIGNNLTDRLTTGACFNTNFPAGGGVFPGMITGAPIRGPAGAGELNCAFERGRSVWLRLTVRPLSRRGR